MKDSSQVVAFVVDPNSPKGGQVVLVGIKKAQFGKKHVDMYFGNTIVRFEASKLIEAIQENIPIE
jgi:hypothetical protein